MRILDSLLRSAEEQFDAGDSDLRIDNVILGKTLYTMKGSDTVFSDMNFCLVLLEKGYGFSYFQEEIDYSLKTIVNKSVLDVIHNQPTFLEVALLDALYCLQRDRSKQVSSGKFSGPLREKARARAELLVQDIPSGARVLLLGAATEIIEAVNARGCTLQVLDLEQQKIGSVFDAVEVMPGSDSALESAIGNADYVIATGMIFVSGTADLVFELVSAADAKLILYMETGANFGPALLQHGAAKVLSEFFPFYDFYGDTSFLISKAE